MRQTTILLVLLFILSFFSITEITAQDRAGDSLALVDLYDSCGGASWVNAANWGTANPINTWQGVVFNTDINRVKTLLLGNKGLTGAIPSSFGNLNELQTLFGRNSAITSLPETIGRVNKLENLVMDNNSLTSLPDSISMLTSLVQINVNNNSLNTLPSGIGGLSSLTTLDLRNNNLSTLPSSIGNLSALTTLYLDTNQLTSLPSTIGGLSSLDYLTLIQNNIETLPDEIGNLGLLEILQLSNNNLSSLPSDLSGLSSIQKIFLTGNNISSISSSTFSGLSTLKRIDLRSNNLSSIPAITGLDSLEHLDFGLNNFTTVPSIVYNLPRLTTIYADRNGFLFDDLEYLLGTAITTISCNYQDSIGAVDVIYTFTDKDISFSGLTAGSKNVYSWYQDGSLVQSSSNPTLNLDNISLAEDGVYSCRVTSDSVTGVTLYERPVIVYVTSNLNLSAVSQTHKVDLSWNKTDYSDFARYIISADGTPLDTLTVATDTVYTVEGLGSNSSIVFSVTLENTTGSVSLSDSATGMLLNTKPEFLSAGSAEAYEDSLFNYEISSSDADGDPLALSLLYSPSWISLEDSLITGTPLDGNGDTVVIIEVSDGELKDTLNLTINVNSINDAPVIQSATAQTVQEDGSIEITTAMLTVSDPDDSVFTVTIYDGANFSIDGNTVIPNSNYNGVLYVNLYVSDGEDISNTAILSVTVTPVNDEVIIDSITDQTMEEDGALALSLGMVHYHDIDAASGSYSLKVYGGDDYSVSGVTIKPDTNFNGMLKVPLSVMDDNTESRVDTMRITVTPIDDRPYINSTTAQSISEDNQITISTSMLSITDVDDSFFTLVVGDGANYSVSGNTVIPDSDYYGVLSVPLNVFDGELYSNTANISITVTSVNDKAVIDSVTDQTVQEDGYLDLLLNMVNFHDVDLASGSYDLKVYGGVGYSVSGNTIQPDLNLNGVLKVPVTVIDNDTESDIDTMQVSIIPVNDIPNISSASAQSTPEDVQLTITTNMLSISDPDNSTFTPIIGAGENYTVSGTSIIPSQDFFGDLSVAVSVTDGEDTSNTAVLPVTVTAVMDKAVIDSVQEQSILEEASITLLLSMVSFHDVDATSSSYSLKVFDGDGYSVSGNTIQADTDRNGVLKVPVAVIDNDTESDTDTMLISIIPVNDIPIIDSAFAQSTPEDVQLTISTSMLSITDPDNSVFTLVVGNGANYVVSGNSVIPSLNYYGEISVPLYVIDGEDTSNTVNLPVSVTSVNDNAVIDSVTDQTMLEDGTLALTVNMVTFHDVDSSVGLYDLKVFDGNWYSVSGNTIQPAENFNGVLRIPVAVIDEDSESDADTILVTVTPVNDAPYVAIQLSHTDTLVYVGMSFEHEFPAELFADHDSGDVLDWDATRSDGGSLPSWLSFNGARLKGTLRKKDVGVDSIRIFAIDPSGLSAYIDFIIYIEPETGITVVSNDSRTKKLLSSSNPVNLSDGEVFFQIPSDLSGKGELTIMSALGEILEQKEYQLSGGETLLWDLRDRNDNPVGSGTFLVLLRAVRPDGTRVVQKLLQGIKE